MNFHTAFVVVWGFFVGWFLGWFVVAFVCLFGLVLPGML